MSLDLNNIVNLLNQLKFAIGERNPANAQKLEQIGKEEWEKIAPEKYKKFIDVYQKYLKAVITAKGGTTKYLMRGTFIIVHSFFSFSSLKLHVTYLE